MNCLSFLIIWKVVIKFWAKPICKLKNINLNGNIHAFLGLIEKMKYWKQWQLYWSVVKALLPYQKVNTLHDSRGCHIYVVLHDIFYNFWQLSMVYVSSLPNKLPSVTDIKELALKEAKSCFGLINDAITEIEEVL